MFTVTVQEAQAKLSELIHGLTLGNEVLITENDQPVAKLVCTRITGCRRPQAGLAKGMITIMADDDEHLKDFTEYMP